LTQLFVEKKNTYMGSSDVLGF